jgi:uncharacterized protein YdeI (YjbR/CyaY-like superfamily)
MKPTYFESAEAFRAWLEQNHATAREVLVGFYKKGSGRCCLTRQEALDAALAFGWIDGVGKRVNEDSYTIRYSPRKPGSVWSEVNTRRAQELAAQGLMTKAGLEAFEKRDEKKTRQFTRERKGAELSPELAAKLRANAKASAFFDAQPPGYRRIIAFWVMSAKKEETRLRRMGLLIQYCAKGKRLEFMKKNPPLE